MCNMQDCNNIENTKIITCVLFNFISNLPRQKACITVLKNSTGGETNFTHKGLENVTNKYTYSRLN